MSIPHPDDFKKLTDREKRTLEAKAANPELSDAQAAREGGYQIKEGGSAGAIMSRIRHKMGPLLEQQGVTLETILGTFRDCLKAEKSLMCPRRFFEEGRVVNEEVVQSNVPDYATRLRAAVTVGKLLGLFQEEQERGNQPAVNLHLHLQQLVQKYAGMPEAELVEIENGKTDPVN